MKKLVATAAAIIGLFAVDSGESQDQDFTTFNEPSTQIVTNDSQTLHYVQTFANGIKRDVNITVGKTSESRKLPIQPDGSEMIFADGISISTNDDGYSVRLNFAIPAGEDSQNSAKARGWWLSSLLGIQEAWAEGAPAGASLSMTETVSNAQSVIESAGKALDSTTVDLIKTAQDVGEMIKDLGEKTEGPITRMEDIAQKVKNGAKVAEHGMKIVKMVSERNAMRDKLRALRKCAENPTNPLAKKAQKEDPHYKEATTDALDAAERDLTINTIIRMVATTGNSAASTLLSKMGTPAKAIGKGVSLLAKVEDKMLQHVAEEYIMKDAGKGVVPCDCLPGYSPLPPSEQVSSEPPAELQCNEPKPEELVCKPAPAKPPKPPEPPKPPPSSLTCAPMTHAYFHYSYSSQTGGCAAIGCGSQSEGRVISANATLHPIEGGYQGSGPGAYYEMHDDDGTLRIPKCPHWHSIHWVNGRISMQVNAMFSINNSVTGGLDTGGMPENTAVVEILLNSETLHDEEHRFVDCEPPTAESIDTQALGMDCHFYYVDLYRGGTYQVYKDGDPQSGICTLTISK